MSKLWEEAKALFFEASELPTEQRGEFIKSKTQGNKELEALVLELMDGDEKSAQPHSASQIISRQAQSILNESYIARIGDRLAGYQITDTLGEGGMGIVYLAERVDSQFHQTVAIKVIHSNNLINETIKRFRQEREILASLQHPNIAQLIDGGESESGLPYIVMEYIKGENIIEYCKTRKLTITERLDLFQQVLNAIDYAHQRLVIHRDIKPSNVLVTEQGNVKLLDFGIAKLLEANAISCDPHLTQVDVKVLTPLHASPEQVKSEQATTRTDIYGLCSLLYQIITERPIFDANKASGAEIESWILDKMPTKPSDNLSESHSVKHLELKSTLTGDLDTIILKGLQKEPERRYSSVEQLSSDVHRYLNCFPIKAKPDSRLYIAKKFFQRNRTISLLSAAFFVSVLSFMTALIYQTQQTIEQRDIALRESKNAIIVAEFLKQTFDAASPYISGDKQITPKDLVDNAKNRLTTFKIEPTLMGQLQTTLADVYLSLSDFDSAKSLLAQAKDNYSQVKSLPDLLGVELLKNEIKIEYLIGNLEQAKDNLTPLIQKMNAIKAGQTDREEVTNYQNKYVELLMLKAGIDSDLENHGQAILAAENALDINLSLGDQSTTPLGEAYALLGHIYRQTYQFEKSEKMLLLAAQEAKELYGEFNLELAYAYNQLASTYSQMEQIDKGIAFAYKGYLIRDKLYPNGHAEVVASMGMLSNLHRKQEDFDKAIEYRVLATDNLEKLFGDEHYYVALNALSLADLYIQTENYELASLFIEKGERVIVKNLPADHVHQARAPLLRAKILYKTEQHEDAISMSNIAANFANSAIPTGHWFYGEAMAYLALSYHALSNYDMATVSKENALSNFRTLFGENSERYLSIEKLLNEI